MRSAKARPETIDQYLEGVDAGQRRALESLRRTIRRVAPRAEECISYGLAAFRLDGRMLVGMGATKEHCAFYPMSGATVEAHRDLLRGYDTSKATIRFVPDQPLPAKLVQTLVKARIVENSEAGEAPKASASTKPVRRSNAVPKAAPKTAVQSVLLTLKGLGEARIREEMGPRYGIVAKDAFGVPMARMQEVARELGKNHELAEALWETGNYDARLVAGFVAEPARVTPALMDLWCRDFDNWGVCDTICFHLFDRTPHAFAKIKQWAGEPGEFQRRAAFALLACVALHDKQADNASFLRCLPLVEAAAIDERNFVKKALSWALRAIGTRNVELKAAAIASSEKLAAGSGAASRWVGKDALRALNKSPRRTPAQAPASGASRARRRAT